MATAKQILDARAAGYTDSEIAQHLGGAKYSAAKDAGYSDQDIINHFLPKGDQTLLANIASSDNQGPLDDLKALDQPLIDAGKAIKGGLAGTADLLASPVTSAMDLGKATSNVALGTNFDTSTNSPVTAAGNAVSAAENDQPQTSIPAKIGAGLGSLVTPNQIAMTAAGGPIGEGVGNLLSKGVATFGTTGLGKAAPTIFNALPDVQKLSSSISEGLSELTPQEANFVSTQADKFAKGIKNLTQVEADNFVQSAKTGIGDVLQNSSLQKVAQQMETAIAKEFPNLNPQEVRTLMNNAASQGIDNYLATGGSTTLGGLIREALVGGAFSLLHPGTFMLPFLKEAIKYAPVRNAIISGAPAVTSAVGTATPSLISAGLQATQ